MESRNQGSRPRTQNKFEAKRECSRIQVQVFSKKRSSRKFFRRSPKKKTERKVFKKIFHVISKRGKQKKSSRIFREVSGVFQLHFNRSKKIVLSLSRGQKNFLELEASRPRTSKCVLESFTSMTSLQ